MAVSLGVGTQSSKLERKGFGAFLKENWVAFSWLIGPILFRVAFFPVNHPWDVLTWYNVFKDFSINHSPYETFRTLSLGTQAENLAPYFEYYAYPPGLIYLYWPIAHLYALVDTNLTYYIAREGIPFPAPIPWYFNFFFKIPLLLADMGIVLLLWKMGGKSIAKRYAWSPYAVMVVMWNFDSLMVFCLVWSAYALKKGRNNQAALALAIGTIIKFVPMFVVPAVILYLIRQKISFNKLAMFCLVYSAATLIMVFPFLDGTLYSLGFHNARVGGGLTWHSLFFIGTEYFPDFVGPGFIYFSQGVGGLVLPIGLLITYAYTYKKNLSLNLTFAVTLLGYLVSTKLVNEVYALPVIPFILLELQAHPTPLKERLYKLLWAIPLAWAMLSVPFFNFLTTFFDSLGSLERASVINLNIIWQQEMRKPLVILFGVAGTFYTLLCLYSMHVFAAKPKPVSKPAALEPAHMLPGSTSEDSPAVATAVTG